MVKTITKRAFVDSVAGSDRYSAQQRQAQYKNTCVRYLSLRGTEGEPMRVARSLEGCRDCGNAERCMYVVRIKMRAWGFQKTLVNPNRRGGCD